MKLNNLHGWLLLFPVISIAAKKEGIIVFGQETEAPLGQACNPNGTTSKCGANASCQKLSSYCKFGVCACDEGYISLPGNSLDCFKVLRLGDSCSPGNSTEELLMPEAAICNSTSKKVSCGYPIKSTGGPCSADAQGMWSVKGFHEKCDNKTQQPCNEKYNHACIWSSFHQRSVCQCSDDFYEDNGICVLLGITDFCTNNTQCNRQFGHGSNAAQCKYDFILSRCTCNNEANFVTIIYSGYENGAKSKATITCVNSPGTRATEGQLCSAAATKVSDEPFCGDGLGCQQCPEFDSVKLGYCVSGEHVIGHPSSTATELTIAVTNYARIYLMNKATTVQLTNYSHLVFSIFLVYASQLF